jgi:hypothetical protein
MCLGGGGGGGSTKAPVAGGYGEVTTDNGAGSSKYSLYDNTGKDITKDYTLDKKKQVVRKGMEGVGDQFGLGAASYLYTRDA